MPTTKKKRLCLCGQAFKPMTDNVWKHVKRMHEHSPGHKKRVRQKSRKS